MDPLSDLVALVRPHAIVSKPITGRGVWGVRYAHYGQPGYALVLAGRCYLALDEGAGAVFDEPRAGRDGVQLETGDFVLLSETPAFSLRSRPGVRCRVVEPTEQAVHHGDTDGPPDFRMLGGAFRLDPVNAPLLVAALPRLLHVRAGETRSRRLGQLIALVQQESEAQWPGRDLIVSRLLEVTLVECLRWQDADRAIAPGILAGMREPAVAKALDAMHADVSRSWTVAELGRQAGMSRSVFAERFQTVVGYPPIEYLARWRMALAKRALVRGGTRLERLAEEIGYKSASAFSTAFRRRVGCAPGAFARQRRAEDGREP